jgi:hypothetical protein
VRVVLALCGEGVRLGTDKSGGRHRSFLACHAVSTHNTRTSCRLIIRKAPTYQRGG